MYNIRRVFIIYLDKTVFDIKVSRIFEERKYQETFEPIHALPSFHFIRLRKIIPDFGI